MVVSDCIQDGQVAMRGAYASIGIAVYTFVKNKFPSALIQRKATKYTAC
jgi:hypothetical protein